MEDLASLKEESRRGGGQSKIDAIRKSGRKTARERIESLVDKSSFVEIDAFVKSRETEHGMDRNSILGDGVMAGSATIEGSRVMCFSQDFSVFGGSMGGLNVTVTVPGLASSDPFFTILLLQRIFPIDDTSFPTIKFITPLGKPAFEVKLAK